MKAYSCNTRGIINEAFQTLATRLHKKKVSDLQMAPPSSFFGLLGGSVASWSASAADLSAWLGTSATDGSLRFVTGLVSRPLANHCSIALRSYVCPSSATTGSLIAVCVIGHRSVFAASDARPDARLARASASASSSRVDASARVATPLVRGEHGRLLARRRRASGGEKIASRASERLGRGTEGTRPGGGGPSRGDVSVPLFLLLLLVFLVFLLLLARIVLLLLLILLGGEPEREHVRRDGAIAAPRRGLERDPARWRRRARAARPPPPARTRPLGASGAPRPPALAAARAAPPPPPPSPSRRFHSNRFRVRTQTPTRRPSP